MRTVGIGLLGCGTVGSSVAQWLTQARDAIARRTGVGYELRAIAIRDPYKPRPPALDRALFTTDARSVVESPKVDAVIELIGGVSDAMALVQRALESGRHLVTANKDLLATAGSRLHSLAARTGASLRFDAAVGGAIPILRTLDEALASDNITAVAGVVNGTSTAILSSLEAGMAFEAALERAQRLGYAEADPSNDVDGTDAAHKLALLVRLAFGLDVASDEIRCNGIGALSRGAAARALRLGLRVRLIAAAQRTRFGLLAEVGPVLVAEDHEFARTSGAENVIAIDGSAAGRLILRGQGAGGAATASSVVADVVSLLSSIADGTDRRPRHRASPQRPLRIEPLFHHLTRAEQLDDCPIWDDAAIELHARAEVSA
jgi:homoserine dehydrogenase